MINETENLNQLSEPANILAVPHKIVNKFLKSFFGTLENCSVGNVDGINTAIIIMDSDENTIRNKINLKMYKEYNNFLRIEFGKDPKYYNRNVVYEMEVKENKMFIRWV